MPKQFNFKLRADSPLHLYIDKIKEMIEADGYLHPTMKKLLIMMKKSRMRYIILGKVREVIVVKEGKDIIDKEYYLLERSVNLLTGYSVTYINDENIKLLKTNARAYYKELLDFYDKMGYEATEELEVDRKTIQDIAKTIKFPKKER